MSIYLFFSLVYTPPRPRKLAASHPHHFGAILSILSRPLAPAAAFPTSIFEAGPPSNCCASRFPGTPQDLCTCTTRPERPPSACAKPRPEAKIIGRVHGNVPRILRPVQLVSCRQKPCIVNLVNHVQQRRKCNLPDNCSNCQNQAQRKLRDGVSRRRSLSRDGGRYDGDEQPAHECCNRVQSDGVHRYMFRC